MVFPRLATPRRRPFWTLRCLTRLGRSIATSLLARLGRRPTGGLGRRRAAGTITGRRGPVLDPPLPGGLGLGLATSLATLLCPRLTTAGLAAAAAAAAAPLAAGLLALAGPRATAGRLGRGRNRLLPGGRLRDRFGTPGRDVAPVDPDLDPDHPEGRPGRGLAELDVGSQGVERHPTLAIPLPPGHLRTPQATAELDPDALGAGPHRAQDRLLHRPPVADPPLQLRGDVLRHQLGIELGLLDLLDGDADPVAEPLLEVLAQLIDRGPPFADHDARLGGVDRDRRLGVGGALGLDPRDAGVAQARGDQAPHLQVFVEELGVVLAAGEPVRLPAPVDPESKRVRVDLVTQWTIPPRRPRRTPPAAPVARSAPAPPLPAPATDAGSPTGRRPAPGAPRPRP